MAETALTYRAQGEAILDAGGWTTDAKIATDLGCSLHTSRHIRQGWQRANGKPHKCGNGQLPSDVVDLIFFARDIEGASWKLVAQAVEEIYGLAVSVNRCADLYRRGGYKKRTVGRNIDYLGSYAWEYAVPVPRYIFPLKTAVGIMWGWPVEQPLYQHRGIGKYQTCCDHCDHLAHCLAHPGDVCRCETTQESEVL